MKITIITSNQPRHNYLINSLSKFSSNLHVIQEVSSHKIYTNKNIKSGNIKEKYFKKVIRAEKKIFGFQHIKTQKINLLTIPKGDLNNYPLKLINHFLKSNLYIIFGCSIIKGSLLKFLISKNAINIHMGISPYYRGTDCNFWALYDENYSFIGGSVIKLSKKIDAGDILFHSIAKFKQDKFEYTMQSVKTTIDNLISIIEKNQLHTIKPTKQDLNKTIRKSTKKDFNENIIKKFYAKKISLKNKKKSFKINKYII
tara:strand:- start:3691 stop:4458 length:768 start_codon:yes stop_codon:yes gene_type:complete